MKTKTILSLIIVCYYSLSSYSQIDSSEIIKKKWLIGININTVEPATDFVIQGRLNATSHRIDKSYCLGLNISYYLKNNTSIRLSSKYTKHRAMEISDSRETWGSSNSGSFIIDTIDANQTVLYFNPGILWDLKYKKMTFYGGFQIVYKNYGKISGNTYQWAYSPKHTTEQYIWYYYTEEGGHGIGAGPVAGFNFNIWKNINIGAEFSSSFSYYKIGGKVTSEKTLNSYINPANNYSKGYSEAYRTDKGWSFTNIISSINVSINF